jgi:hypothetical protein
VGGPFAVGFGGRSNFAVRGVCLCTCLHRAVAKRGSSATARAAGMIASFPQCGNAGLEVEAAVAH